MDNDLLYSIFLGISLSAACGLRAFIPAFVFSVAAALGYVVPPGGFSWIGAPTAVILLAAAGGAELAASFSSRTERLFDMASTPAAMLVGSLLAMAAFREVSFLVGTLVPPLIGIGIGGLSQSLAGLVRSRWVAAPGRRGSAAAAEAAGSISLSALGVLLPPAGGIIALTVIASRWRDVREALRR